MTSHNDPNRTSSLLNSNTSLIDQNTERMKNENRLKETIRSLESDNDLLRREMRNIGDIDDLKLQTVSDAKLIQTQFEEIQALKANVLEWVNSDTVFRRLANKYGAELGKERPEIVSDMSELVRIIADEDPKFKNTKFTQKYK